MNREASGRRGQLVLVAAIALAVALVPLTLAYLQLGYHEDAGGERDPAQQISGTLDRSLHDSTSDIAATYRWEQRAEAVATVRERLEPTLASIATARLADGHVYSVTFNETRARLWVDRNCPGGSNRQFGPCDSTDGLAVQERNGQTHVLGAAFDIRVTTPESETTVTVVLEHRTG